MDPEGTGYDVGVQTLGTSKPGSSALGFRVGFGNHPKPQAVNPIWKPFDLVSRVSMLVNVGTIQGFLEGYQVDLLSHKSFQVISKP